MKEPILERYSRTDDGTFVIDIAADRVEDLYSYFDKTSSFLKKDLDQELVDFIVESARELGREPFTIHVSLAVAITDSDKQRLQGSIRHYFLYLRELERRQMRTRARASLVLLVAGLCILTLTVLINQLPDIRDTVVGRVFAEGLTIAAWVSLWEALATFLINWAPHRANLRLYDRIARTAVGFR